MSDFYIQFIIWFLAFFAGYALQRYLKLKKKVKPSSYPDSKEYCFIGGTHNGEWHEVPANSKYWHLVERSKDDDMIIPHDGYSHQTCSTETYEYKIFLCQNGQVHKEEYHLIKR